MNRRGFTLIELVSSLFISTVLIGAIGSAITLTANAIPDSSRSSEASMIAQRTLATITNDVRFATSVEVDEGKGLSLVVADRGSDDTPDRIKYSWGGDKGDPLMRAHEDLGAAAILSAVDNVEFGWASFAGAAEPDHPALTIHLEFGKLEFDSAQRCLNLDSEP